MQLIADIIKKLNEEKVITKNDLYDMKESDVINIIENSKHKTTFDLWRKAKKVEISKEIPENAYYVHHGAKVRYINPLLENNRITKVCKEVKEFMDKNLSYDMTNYVYINEIKEI